MKRLFVISLLIVFIAMFGFSETYKIGMVPWIGFSPLNVADANGYFEELGIDVEVVIFEDGLNLNDALAYGKIQFAYHMLGDTISYIAEGEDLAIIAELDWSNGGDMIIAKQGTKMRSLKGEKIGLYLDLPSVNYFLAQYLEANRVKLTQFEVVEVDPGGLTENFIANRLNVIISFGPFAVEAIENGNGEVVATSADYPGCIPEGLACQKSLLANSAKRADTVKILKALIKAAEWIQKPANWASYVEILNTTTFAMEPLPEEVYKIMYDSVKLHDKAAVMERNKNNGGLDKFIKDFNTFLIKNKMTKKRLNANDVIDNSIIIDALK